MGHVSHFHTQAPEIIWRIVHYAESIVWKLQSDSVSIDKEVWTAMCNAYALAHQELSGLYMVSFCLFLDAWLKIGWENFTRSLTGNQAAPLETISPIQWLLPFLQAEFETNRCDQIPISSKNITVCNTAATANVRKPIQMTIVAPLQSS